MHAVNSGMGEDGHGAISEQELLGSTQLTAEMSKALRAAFAYNLEAVEEAIAHIDAGDFGKYRRETASGTSRGEFDWKASAKALIDALDPSALAGGWVGKAGLESLATKLQEEKLEKLASALTGLASTLLAADTRLDFLAVKREAQRVPRVRARGWTGPGVWGSMRPCAAAAAGSS